MKKQFIQRPGINPKTNLPYEQVELAATGYVDLQEASDIAGYIGIEETFPAHRYTIPLGITLGVYLHQYRHSIKPSKK